MNQFIKQLLKEYRDNYKYVSVLQGMDEEQTKKIKNNVSGQGINLQLERDSIPATAWKEIQKFKYLSILRDDDNFKEYESNFLMHLDKPQPF